MPSKDFFRGRRLRQSAELRDLVRETTLRPEDLIQPYFVVEGDSRAKRAIPSMPGQYQLGIEALVERIRPAMDKGLRAVILFGVPLEKDPQGLQAYASQGIVQQAIRALKQSLPGLLVITDVCLCEYTSHGHCGLIEGQTVLNDPTLELLAATAVSHAEAGADMVAPSDMMDGRIQAVRQALDNAGFNQTPIMSYAVKYASAFYGPFREAAESSPQFGDRKTYQMDPANVREGLLEARADQDEGADLLMVKPALAYLDVLARIRQQTDKPLAAYHVSGEYSLIKAGARQGWIDEQAVALESLTSIKRAGADLILTYFGEQVLDWLSGPTRPK